jgi:hypothetical protein
MGTIPQHTPLLMYPMLPPFCVFLLAGMSTVDSARVRIMIHGMVTSPALVIRAARSKE